MTLCKQHLARKITAMGGYSNHKSNQLLESLLERIKSSLECGEEVMISGFGKFQVKDKKSRRGRNPVTGNHLVLDARRIVLFRCSAVLKKNMNS